MPGKDSIPPGPAGKKLGHYEIVSPLGEGGMGVVYKGRDTHLNRFVALKTLRPSAVANPDRRRRFIQEARAASALNHPNIVHVYDIDTEAGVDYIAMEFVDGLSLGHWVKLKRPSQRDILDCAVQAAGALDAAHHAGIIHRDLKPANIMITGPSSPRPGLVKILDFGLAKLMEPEPDQAHMAEIPTRSYGEAEGFDTIVGTPGYMSPEQVAGWRVDQRSDIFAFGLVLYFLATGQSAYQGTGGMVMASILRDDPPAPSQVASDIDPGLEAVIWRCLRKDPDRRYQSMVEVKIALEDLKEASITGRHSGTFSWQPQPPPQATASFPWGKAVAGVLLLAAIVAGAWFWLRPPTRALEPVLKRLTTDSGLSLDPAISPDGKMFAYSSDRSGEGNLDIWVRQVAGGDPIRITHDPADDNEPAFSPDGTMLAFHSDRDGGGLYVVPTLGGQERRLADGGRRPRFSPDGKQIAYWTGEPFREIPDIPRSAAMYVVDTGGGQPRRLQSDFVNATRPLWTPDGSHILFWGSKDRNLVRGFPVGGWWVTPVEGGAAVAVTSATPAFDPKTLRGAEPSGWRNDNIVFSMRQEDYGLNVYEAPISFRNWQITAAPHRLTFGTTQEGAPSVAADGSLVFSSIALNLDVYGLPVDVNHGKPTGPLQRLTSDLADDSAGSLSADGKTLAFCSLRSGQREIWIKNLATGQERMLIAGRGPKISPDGTHVALLQDSSQKFMIVPTGGGVGRQFGSRALEAAAWSPDNSFLLVWDSTTVQKTIEVLDLASGKVSEYLKRSTGAVLARGLSPDGRWLSFAMDAEGGGHVLAVAPFRRSAPPPESEWIEVTDSRSNDFHPLWSPNGQILYFISERDGFACLWARRMDPLTQQPQGDPFPVQHLHSAALRMRAGERYLSVAKDKLAFSMEERAGSIWMLQFK